jgi:ubiquinone/menaquinone biosynthesis C-methylase UbiE
MNPAKPEKWDAHYRRDRSALAYPDENLVRLTAAFLKGRDAAALAALDLGCGSGRHIGTLLEMGLGAVTGVDYSMEALAGCAARYPAALVRADNTALPFRDGSADLVVTWGSLHYSDKKAMKAMLGEIHRVLKKGGWHVGTLRSARDTHLRRGKHLGDNVWITDLADLESSTVSFYDEEELREALSLYRESAYGIMERTVPGDMARVISHWYYRAEK